MSKTIRVPSPRQMEAAMSVLMEARDRLIREEPDIIDDEKLLHDMLEGETGDAMDTLDALIRASIHAGSMADMGKTRAMEVRERASRYERRQETLRGVVFAALSALELTRHEQPDFTVSIRNLQPSVVITDETALSDDLVRIERKPDKALIKAALTAGQIVPGAELSNAPQTLSVRTK